MKRVTLTTLIDPQRKIQAIKNLRASSRLPESPVAVLGLKEAKDIVDALQNGVRATVEVADDHDLDESFLYVYEEVAGIDKSLVLDFVLDVLAECPPATATRIMNLKTYRLVKEALR